MNANRKPFKVVKQLTKQEIEKFLKDNNTDTAHINERISRLESYKELKLMDTQIIDGFEVDKDHVNGNEIHLINKSGVIYIYNAGSGRFITVLGARPQQIKRYYQDLNIRWSNEINTVITLVMGLVKKYNTNNL